MKFLKRVLIFFVALYVLSFLGNLGSAGDASFSREMKSDLDRANATGTKIVTYHVEDEKYSTKYLPRSLRAKEASEVGAVLEVTAKQTHQRYGMNGAIWKSADILTLTLIDCDTQTVIDVRTFIPHFPNKSNGSVKYDTKGMEEWIETSWAAYLSQNG